MAFMHHGNRIKHLNGTSGCKHYHGLEASNGTETHCAAHAACCKAALSGADTAAKRGSHVVMANQSGAKPGAGGGYRYIIDCCAKCNGTKDGTVFDVRANAIMHNLDGKPCRASACGRTHALCDCGEDF